MFLSKPIIVALLLVTTYSGLVAGSKAWPSASLTFWTLLGGALAAAGSSALNQYIDRELDKNMQRTAKRPLADGRLTAAEGLSYGLALSLISYYVMAGFVNLLAALLSLAGIFYYVIFYSVLLKKATVQNIVIGGGAGAIPPMVGWAAATGQLGTCSLDSLRNRLYLDAAAFLGAGNCPHERLCKSGRADDARRARRRKNSQAYSGLYN